MKKLFLDRNKYIGCSLYANLAPSVFIMAETDGKAALSGETVEPAQNTAFWHQEKANVARAVHACPVNALHF